MEKVTDKGKVVCQICGEEFPIITPSHLKNKHGISLSIYRERFPDCPITSVEYKARQRYLKGNLFSKTEENPVVEDIDLTKLTLTQTDVLDIEREVVEKKPELTKPEKKADLVVKQVKIQKTNNLFPHAPKIHPRKLQILEFLRNLFPTDTIINNYMIDKVSLSGSLDYRIVTDICIPLKKIDLEFPKTFWHNHGMPDIHRNHKIERDGWIIIEINKIDPTVEDVKTYLEHRKLI